ncbi:ankyrin repeat domain-containing protein [Ralstonia soli]|uniref:Ankyrin repeat domain-containing protein n=1 Tax=Ralstonia soli TaxID=2953896 RepID=A0ABT1AKC7_9RALS|nr:ankyrin repeat domain-containing protein [Ralstonia soli]MCO5398763.1 ankyrin repeat domain-containing protein [Ralstonia soli]
MQYRDNLKQKMRNIALAGALAMVLSGAAFASPQDDLRAAVEYNRPVLVQKYVAQGVDPNLNTRDGTPLLVDALKDKNVEVAEALMRAKGIDFERTNAAGENALMMAAYQGLLPIVKLMVETYDVEVNKTGWTALHYAATNGYDDIVKYLIDHAAYIDAESPNATTPLMMAAMGGHITTVKLLLDEGADMNLRNQQKMDVIDFAKRYHQDEIAAGLESRRRKLAEQGAKPAPAQTPAAPTAAVPAAQAGKSAAPDVPTPMPPAKPAAAAPRSPDTVGTPTNMLFDSNR